MKKAAGDVQAAVDAGGVDAAAADGHGFMPRYGPACRTAMNISASRHFGVLSGGDVTGRTC